MAVLRFPASRCRSARGAAALLFFAIACDAFSQAQPPVAAGVVTEDRFPVQKSTFPGGVSALPDVVYGQPAGFRAPRLDL